MTDTNKERADFEAWYASTDDAPAEPDHIYEFDEDGMNDLTKDCIWLGWQARAAKAPAAPTGWYALAADGMATLCVDRDDAEKTAADSEKEWPNCGPFRAVQLYTAPPAPTEQWVSVADRLPDPFCEVIVYPRPSDYCCEASVDTHGQWNYIEYETGFGANYCECKVTHWKPMGNPQGAAKGDGNG